MNAKKKFYKKIIGFLRWLPAVYFPRQKQPAGLPHNFTKISYLLSSLCNFEVQVPGAYPIFTPFTISAIF
jgi:hypothetical protein